LPERRAPLKPTLGRRARVANAPKLRSLAQPRMRAQPLGRIPKK
jgi:hypothetical protein